MNMPDERSTSLEESPQIEREPTATIILTRIASSKTMLLYTSSGYIEYLGRLLDG